MGREEAPSTCFYLWKPHKAKEKIGKRSYQGWRFPTAREPQLSLPAAQKHPHGTQNRQSSLRGQEDVWQPVWGQNWTSAVWFLGNVRNILHTGLLKWPNRISGSDSKNTENNYGAHFNSNNNEHLLFPYARHSSKVLYAVSPLILTIILCKAGILYPCFANDDIGT